MKKFLELHEENLLEAFDKPLEYHEDPVMTGQIRGWSQNYDPPLEGAQVYRSQLTPDHGVQFLKIKRLGAWEVHFDTLDPARGLHTGHKDFLSGGDRHKATKIFSTALDIMKPHIEAGEHFRIQTTEPRKLDLFKKVIGHIIKRSGTNYEIHDVGLQPGMQVPELHTIIVKKPS